MTLRRMVPSRHSTSSKDSIPETTKWAKALGNKKSPIGKWQMVMVVLHPTGDPKDMKSMVGALRGNL